MKKRRDSLVSLLFAALFFTAQLAADSEIPRTHASDALFAADRLIQVEIEMAPEDWQALRISHRVTGEDFSQVVENPYEYYQAKVIIDGQVLNSVGIRKKGFFGSAIREKFIKGHATAWRHEPYVLGSYAGSQPGGYGQRAVLRA